VRGPHPAACFTEQPLEQVPVSLHNVDGATYQGYGIALNKVDLYNYGGRPVIYGDNEVYNSLSDELKYLWVCYRPIRPDDSGYPNDFMWEREWRCRLADKDFTPWEHDLKGVPLLLPDDFRRVARSLVGDRWQFKEKRSPTFRIIVRLDIEVQPIRELIEGLTAGPKESAYLRIYYAAVKKAQIISLEHVERNLEEGDASYHRIEDLPSPEEMLDFVPSNPKKKEWPFKKRL